MRALALLLWGLGATGSFFYGEGGVPALVATYQLSADRWRQGRQPYQTLQVPADPLTLWLYREAPQYARLYLLIWKAIGGILLMGFLLRRPSREHPPAPLQWVLMGIVGGMYQLLPYSVPSAVGETAYALTLWLGESAPRPFVQGILLGFLAFWHPTAGWALLFWVYRRWEAQESKALLYHLLGFVWGLLALSALWKVLQGEAALNAYLSAYILSGWQVSQGESIRWLLGAVAAGIMLFFIGEVGLRPYRERAIFRRVLWAGVGAAAAGLSAFSVMALLSVRSRCVLLGLLQFLAGVGYTGYAGFLLTRHTPKTPLVVAGNSCFLGVPPTYLRLEGPYGCDLTVPLHWQSSNYTKNWENLYKKLGETQWIYDSEGFMTTCRYFMPLRMAPYRAVDTTLPHFIRLYERQAYPRPPQGEGLRIR